MYGSKSRKRRNGTSWDGTQQAAFLIYAWQLLASEIRSTNSNWATSLRDSTSQMELNEIENMVDDLAFSGPTTLLNTDQGVRGVLYIINDYFYLQATQNLIDLEAWSYKQELTGDLLDDISNALDLLRQDEKITTLLLGITKGLVKFDWRTVNYSDLSDEERTAKLVFRGSGGYKELRRQLLKLLSSETGEIGKIGQLALKTLRYK